MTGLKHFLLNVHVRYVSLMKITLLRYLSLGIVVALRIVL